MNGQRDFLSYVYAAVAQHNADVAKEQRLDQRPESVLFGEGGKLESVELIGVIISLEEELEKELGTPVVISGEWSLTQDPSPFATLGSLAEHIRELVEEAEKA